MAEQDYTLVRRRKRNRIQFEYTPPPEIWDAVTSLKQRTKLHTHSQLFNYLILLGHRLYQHKKAGGKIILEDAKGGREPLLLL